MSSSLRLHLDRTALAVVLGAVAVACARPSNEKVRHLGRAELQEKVAQHDGFVVPLPKELPPGFHLMSYKIYEVDGGRRYGQAFFGSVVVCAQEKTGHGTNLCGEFSSPDGTIRRDVGGLLLVVRMNEKNPENVKLWNKVDFATDYSTISWLDD
ncbi:hypothetical protein ACFHYQ_15880 [Sphaerimonospora cavernae]|uniref:Exosortase system-associated protein, TIGR04073 family n=1 Tax=Sphaerimonospora cavernae TaxID=1740611 RepID=A0ABV6U5Q7_9ACTN